MKEMRAASKPVKKVGKSLKKHNKLFVSLIILPIAVIFTTGVLWLVFPAGALNQNGQEVSQTTDVQPIIDKINQPLNPPEPESQETSRQIAEQKRIEAEKAAAEKARLEKERILALEKALKIKQARDDARNKICFIGDSISVVAADITISMLNAGHSTEDPPYDGINIARGGSTTGDWVGSIGPDAHNCNRPGLRAVMIMLGTNDAGHGIDVGAYLANMAHIRSVVSGLGVPVIVNCPILLGSDKDPTNLNPLTPAYCSGLGANGVSTPLDLPLSDSIHPTGDGYNLLASAWANIILNSQIGVQL
jgi:lysophospholipase L1-like esterase